MFAKTKILKSIEDMNKSLLPNKLYCSRSIYRVMSKINHVYTYKFVMIMLKYACSNDLIYSDPEYVGNITYWVKQ